jgi:hypothetical protein
MSFPNALAGAMSIVAATQLIFMLKQDSFLNWLSPWLIAHKEGKLRHFNSG